MILSSTAFLHGLGWLCKRLVFSPCRYPSIYVNQSNSDIPTGMSEAVQQLQWDLSKKNMFFSKDSIEICRIVGQGIRTCMQIWCVYSANGQVHYFTGESGVVYRGYFNTRAGKQLIAIKTCKGTVVYNVIVYHSQVCIGAA